MSFQNLEIVYNFREIKDELEKYEYKFESDSDTEVILKAFHKWGKIYQNKYNANTIIKYYERIFS